jgi:hypothetical protein
MSVLLGLQYVRRENLTGTHDAKESLDHWLFSTVSNLKNARGSREEHEGEVEKSMKGK